MNIVLLSGGSGTRLWPLSNDVRSKQFIKIFKKENGKYQSMVEKIYSQIKAVDKDANIVIATSKTQISAVKNQLGDNVGISLEPCRKDTFPAILLASMYLHDVKKVSKNESIIVCPVDPYVDDSYFEVMQKLDELVQNDHSNLTLMGIEPTYPSSKYGYIIPKTMDDVTEVLTFKEKPTEEVAVEYLKQGALWNAGVFAFKLDYLINRGHELIDFIDYNDLFNKYESLNKISFDYAVVEKEKSIQVMRYAGEWKDLGTWNTLTEAMSENFIGKGIMDETCENTHVLNELNIPVLALGMKDVVIAASPDGIIVSDKMRSAAMKPYVEKIKENVRYAEKSWGTYEVLDEEEDSLTVKIMMKKASSMSYHCHEHRREVWNIVNGSGYVILDKEKKSIRPGDVINIEQGVKHTIHANTPMTIIEVQIGKDISVKDKKKFDLEKGTAFYNVDELYSLWCEKAVDDEDVVKELHDMKDDHDRIEDAFYKDLTFGTGGLRGTIGAGTNMLNIYTVAKATQGVAEYVKANYEDPKVIVGYDSRIKSDLFAKVTCEVLAANNIKAEIYSELRPVPMVSYGVRHEKASLGIMITASHNPAKYNGYKVYGHDGCQITTEAAKEIYEYIDAVDVFEDVKKITFSEGLSKNLISYMPDEVYNDYVKVTKKESLIDDVVNKNVKIIYTPLNGTGLKPVTRVLKESGYTNITVVKEQEQPDGHFPTCPFPNPEVKEAMKLGIGYCKKYDAELLLATDPDCDRVGIAVKDDKDDYQLLTANQTGILLLDYICSRRKELGTLPKDGEFVKTIVTTDLAEEIASYYGLKTVNTLTGFKFIGEEIGRLEKQGKIGSFVFGFEESYGYLTGTYVRDKDGVNASLMICDMFAYYKARGINLYDKLQELYNQFGFCLNMQHSYKFEGSTGMLEMREIMNNFRRLNESFGDYKILDVKDYLEGINGLPKSNVLKFFIKDASIVIRPSGTEPKLKVYITIMGNKEDCIQRLNNLTKVEKQLMNIN